MASDPSTQFIITNNQTIFPPNQSVYPPSQVWVTFAGSFASANGSLTVGSTVVSSPFSLLQPVWLSYGLPSFTAPVTLPYFSANPNQATFSLNEFSGRIYINYGTAALTAPPEPANPGTSPYVVFELTVSGASGQGNLDLSYVDGISTPAATMIRDATTGKALAATSVNPVTATWNIVNNVAAKVPAAACIPVSGGKPGQIARIMSSNACASAYHDWTDLMNLLQQQSTVLNVCSYTSPSSLPATSMLNGALFGYSGGGTSTSPQVANFLNAQGYATTAVFSGNLNPATTKNPNGDPLLNAVNITPGTAGVLISGSGTQNPNGPAPAGSFGIYITQSSLNAGTGIYGANPPYVVYAHDGSGLAPYLTTGIVNDLGGRIVGDLMAGLAYGWANSTVNIASQATATGTSLYGVTFSATTVGGLSTGELFFLLSLVGMQGKLAQWIGTALDPTADHSDPYLAAIAANSQAYGSPFTDRLQGYLTPDTYWYTSNPPAIPGSNPLTNYPLVGFVNLFLGAREVPA